MSVKVCGNSLSGTTYLDAVRTTPAALSGLHAMYTHVGVCVCGCRCRPVRGMAAMDCVVCAPTDLYPLFMSPPIFHGLVLCSSGWQ